MKVIDETSVHHLNMQYFNVLIENYFIFDENVVKMYRLGKMRSTAASKNFYEG